MPEPLNTQSKLVILVTALTAIAFVVGIVVGNHYDLGTKTSCDVSIETQIGELEEINNITGLVGHDYAFCTNSGCYHSEKGWQYAAPAGEIIEERDE